MFVETSISETQDEPPAENDGLYEVISDSAAAEQFLKAHPTAKIVVVIDTHCIENGFFIYKGISPENYAACSLLEVSGIYCPNPFVSHLRQILKDCIPKRVFEYISDAGDTPKHSHKSLILNLACGASISQPGSRNEMLRG